MLSRKASTASAAACTTLEAVHATSNAGQQKALSSAYYYHRSSQPSLFALYIHNLPRFHRHCSHCQNDMQPTCSSYVTFLQVAGGVLSLFETLFMGQTHVARPSCTVWIAMDCSVCQYHTSCLLALPLDAVPRPKGLMLLCSCVSYRLLGSFGGSLTKIAMAKSASCSRLVCTNTAKLCYFDSGCCSMCSSTHALKDQAML